MWLGSGPLIWLRAGASLAQVVMLSPREHTGNPSFSKGGHLVPYTLWLAIGGVVLFLLFVAWLMRKASKRMDENADFNHKSGLPPWMG
jgi:hypothetical protein